MRRGPTVLEVVFVCFAVVVIASMAMPSLQSARSRYRVQSCLTNLTQIGLASLMYAQDNNDRFPPVLSPGAGKTYSVFQALAPYVGRETYWRCPSDRLGMTADDLAWVSENTGAPGMAPFDLSRISYAVNRQVAAPAGRPPYRLDQLPRAPDTVLWYDASFAISHGNLTWPIAARHGGFCNVAYCDGSVSAVHCVLSGWTADVVAVSYARTREGPGARMPLWRVAHGPYAGQTELFGVIREDGERYPSTPPLVPAAATQEASAELPGSQPGRP